LSYSRKNYNIAGLIEQGKGSKKHGTETEEGRKFSYYMYYTVKPDFNTL